MHSKCDSLATRCIHGGASSTDPHRSLSPPLYLTSTFGFQNAEQGASLFEGREAGYVYSRLGNPTVELAASRIAALEEAEAAVLTASGMAAVQTVFHALLAPGSHVVAGAVLYGATHTLLEQMRERWGISVTFVDAADTDAVRQAVRSNTRLVYVETPDNPLLGICNLHALAEIAHQGGALLAVDNTFATPINQRPLTLGADLSLHSATKYLGGHGDLVAGVIAGSSALVSELRSTLVTGGAISEPFTAWLLLRGLKTLHLRVERHNRSALQIARFLEGHPCVARVFYPGLTSHPGHAVAARQMSGFGGVLSFELQMGFQDGVELVNSVQLCTRAVSLGDAETLIEHPASMTHSGVPRQERLRSGITDGLIRLAVGLEAAEDIIADIEVALSRCSLRTQCAVVGC